MSAQRDPDRLIRAFLREGTDQLHDQVYDAVRAEIDNTRQRAVIGPWRMPNLMNRFAVLGGGALALVLAIVVGSQLLARPATGGPGAGTSASPVASQPATATPAPSVAPGLPVGSRHVLIDEGGVKVTITVSAPGWFADQGLLTRDGGDPPVGAGIITFAGDLYVYADPCSWTTTTPATPSKTVDELVAALGAQASRNASAPVGVTVGGFTGKRIELHVPEDADFAACDQATFGSWTTPGATVPHRYHQGPGQVDEVWVFDVNGILTAIDMAYFPATPPDQVAQLRTFIESAQFE